MTSTLLRSGPAPAGPRHASTSDRLLVAGIVVAAAALAVALIGLLVDPRVLGGAPAWLKPLKFGVSVTLYLVTIRWMLAAVPGSRRLLTLVAAVLTVGLGGELALIDLQVLRGTTSHFNESTAFDAAVFYSMGGMIAAVFGVTVVVAVLVLRSPRADRTIAVGVRWGLLIGLLGMLEAGLMIANHGSSSTGGHTVGGPDGGPGLLLTGWSTLHGDLRIGHFLGLHALQALPIVAVLLVRLTRLDERTRVRLVRVAAGGTLGAVLLTTWQALRGQALLSPDATTVVAGGVLAAAVLGAAGLVLAGRTREPAVRR